MNKAELRKTYLSRQRSIAPDTRQELSRKIATRVFSEFDLSGINFLHAFIPIEKFNEVNTLLVFERLWTSYPNIVTVVPRVNFETGEMESVVFGRDTELKKSRWEIEEPAIGDRIAADLIDVILVPGLCFDRTGHRVGYGKGFYDRFLKTCRRDCLKIGLSYFEPVDRITDTHDEDEVLAHIVTPENTIDLAGRKP